MTETDRTQLPYGDWDEAVAAGEFEAVLDCLRDVIDHLEAGNLSLENSVRCYEFGTRLARRCERLLNEAELRITRLDDEAEPGASGF